MGLLQPARLSRVAFAPRGTSRLVGAMTTLYCSFVDLLFFVQTLYKQEKMIFRKLIFLKYLEIIKLKLKEVRV